MERQQPIEDKGVVFKPHTVGEGVFGRISYKNKYGASIVRFSLTHPLMPNGGSYGHEQGLWELGVLKDGDLCYDTPITEDVEGYLTTDEVLGLLVEIENL